MIEIIFYRASRSEALALGVTSHAQYVSKKGSCKDSAPKLRFGARTRRGVLSLSPPPPSLNSFRDPSRSRSGPRNQWETETERSNIKAVCSARSANGRGADSSILQGPRRGLCPPHREWHSLLLLLLLSLRILPLSMFAFAGQVWAWCGEGRDGFDMYVA
jgi:hypothetical protein